MTIARSISAGFLETSELVSPDEPVVPGWVSRLVEGGRRHPLDRCAQTDFCVTDAGGTALVTARVANADALDEPGLRGSTRDAYAGILRRLATLPAPHAVRFWNFIPGIHRPFAGGLDRYMAFNAGRYTALMGLSERPVSDAHGDRRAARAVPTATGIGHPGPDLVVHCLSLAAPGRPVENPRQAPAYRYSARYGPLPPCFARATAVSLPGEGREVLLVGGTASIVGEDSSHGDDLALQFEETCLNLRELITSWNPAAGADWGACFRELRVYAPASLSCAGALVRGSFGDRARMDLVTAQLCRRELLIEIEGLVDVARLDGRSAAP